MWAVRAAVRPGFWLFHVARGCGAPRAAPPLSPCPERALAAFRGGLGCPEGRGGGGRGPRADGRRSRTGGKEGEEEPEAAEEEEEEEEELLRRDPLLPAGTQRVCLVHPDVKWGPGKPPGTRGDRDCGRGLRWGGESREERRVPELKGRGRRGRVSSSGALGRAAEGRAEGAWFGGAWL